MNYYLLKGVKERCKCGYITPDYARFPDPDYKCPKCTAKEWAKELVAALFNTTQTTQTTQQ